MLKTTFWGKLLDLLLPPRCAISGDMVAVQGTLSPRAWQDLRFIAPPLCRICGYPFEFEMEIEAVCAGCMEELPLFSSARAALAYDDASRALILRFKHGDQLQMVPTLVPMLARAGAEALAATDVVIVPVPLHRWRLLKRRYNQAALLALGLARVSGKPCLADGLVRTRATPSQGHMRAKQRADNVRRAFAVNPRHEDALKGKSILLVDDVYTTGATVKECTAALLKAGARAVHVVAVARVVRPV